MANEKFNAAQSIIKTFQKELDDAMGAMDETYQLQSKTILAQHKNMLQNQMDEKIKKTQKDFERNYKHQASLLNIETQKTLLEEEAKLFEAYEFVLSESIQDLRKTKAYRDYLKQCLKQVKEPVEKIYLDQSEMDYFEGALSADLPLGGILIETKNRIYDFDLNKKLKSLILTIQEETDLEKEGGLK